GRIGDRLGRCSSRIPRPDAMVRWRLINVAEIARLRLDGHEGYGQFQRQTHHGMTGLVVRCGQAFALRIVASRPVLGRIPIARLVSLNLSGRLKLAKRPTHTHASRPSPPWSIPDFILSLAVFVPSIKLIRIPKTGGADRGATHSERVQNPRLHLAGTA